MIVAAHVASGALIGALSSSRGLAALAGLASHGLADALPHQDLESRRFESACGLLGVLAIAARHGLAAPTTVGAAAAAAPDLEHVLPLPRPGGRKLYPTHRFDGWHRSGGVGAGLQLVCAAAVLAAVLGRNRPRAR